MEKEGKDKEGEGMVVEEAENESAKQKKMVLYFARESKDLRKLKQKEVEEEQEEEVAGEEGSAMLHFCSLEWLSNLQDQERMKEFSKECPQMEWSGK